MTYKDYIDLGFERTDIDDCYLFNQTGYSGYLLSKELIKGISIEVYYTLHDPKLYIKRGEDQYHIIPIKPEIIKDLINKFTL
jgi:hypothetical protein